MHYKSLRTLMSFVLLWTLISLACGSVQPVAEPTNTPDPTSTETAVSTPTQTPRPSATPRPTQTPNVTGTERAAEMNSEILEYFENGYLTTTDGMFQELDDFSYDWAQLGYYLPFLIQDSVGDFVLSAHFKWDSAFQNSDISGCGFIFGMQPNEDHYAVFLDKSNIFFLNADQSSGYSRPVGLTRGGGPRRIRGRRSGRGRLGNRTTCR